MYIKLDPRDNVAVAVRPVEKGETVDGLTALEGIPVGHKIALRPIPRGGDVVRYGVTVAYTDEDVAAGGLVNEYNTVIPPSPSPDELEYGTAVKRPDQLPEAPLTTFEGYPNGEGFAGTRNLLGIVTTVQCAAGIVGAAVERIRRELLPRYPNVEGVVAVNHAYGCGVAIDAPDAVIPIRAIRNLLRHPNFGGELMLVGLGCEKLSYDRLLEPDEISPSNVLTLQDYRGAEAMYTALLEMAERKLQRLNARRRETLPLSKLLIGMQCGGSDAFSGITANPTLGYAADLLVSAGATVLFSELTEVRDAVSRVAGRIPDAQTLEALKREIRWYDAYLARGGADRSANTTPGNKAGGISNIVEKSMGSVAKSGTAAIVEVLSPGERPTKRGLIFAATPASDFVCGSCQLASGIGLQVFSTGRGTPYGLAAAPVVKVCTQSSLKERWPDIIDFDAGAIVRGASLAETGEALFRLIVDVAGGRRAWSESAGVFNDLCVFNPAPLT